MNITIYLCIVVLTVELLKFYGPHHKDYADCHGKLVFSMTLLSTQ